MKRFSLATLLLLVTVVALAIALFIRMSQLTKAQTELTKLRNEIRVLDPSEPDKMRAIQVPAFGQNQWRWRIKLPENENFVLRWAYNDIPADRSMPTQVDPTYNHPMFVAPDLPSDEFMLLINAFEEDGKWKLGFKAESSSEGTGQFFDFASEMQANDSSWLAKQGGNAVHALAGRQKTAVNPIDSPFVLLRYLKGLNPAPGVTKMNLKSTDGILIWIERAGDPK